MAEAIRRAVADHLRLPREARDTIGSVREAERLGRIARTQFWWRLATGGERE
ncbi:MAG: hypothetical protein SangKO_016480 [Sandaracinaceae bacterium]